LLNFALPKLHMEIEATLLILL